MHKIGDNILYGATGVMTIVDVREESVGDISRSYYILKPALSRSESLTYVPADNEMLVAAMRPLMTKDEVYSLLEKASIPEYVEWVEGNRPRAEVFKRIMESGDRSSMISMIHAIDEQGARRLEEGKKNFLSDENAKQKAMKLLCSEIALVLSITEEEAEELLCAKMKP